MNIVMVNSDTLKYNFKSLEKMSNSIKLAEKVSKEVSISRKNDNSFVEPTIKKVYEYVEDGIFGNDDPVSQERRKAIREHYFSWLLPYQDLYEKEGRKTDYEMKKMLAEMVSYPQKEQSDPILNLPISKVKAYGKNSYRGQTLAMDPQYLKVLKESGIKQVVDLIGYESYQKDVEDNGLSYFLFPMEDYVWNERAFKNESDCRAKYYRDAEIYGMKGRAKEEYVKKSFLIHKKAQREFIDKFVEYINVMQNGYFYIACDYGTYKTDDALLLNNLFNPKFEKEPLVIDDYYKVECLENLYRNLTKDDKKKMGWSEAFDKNVITRLYDSTESMF